MAFLVSFSGAGEAGAMAVSVALMLFQNSVEDFFDAESQAVGFGEAADFWIAISRAENRRELAAAVRTFVVHLDDDDALEACEDFLQPVRQRMHVPQVECGNVLPAL